MRTSTFPEHASLEGDVRGTGDLVVRGLILGNVDLDGILTVEGTGVIRGEVRARGMIVRGVVEGPVTVLELLRLESGARVVGDVSADRVSAASGTVLRGRVRMTGADRLRRTAGGTLSAPFTSSGSIDAPILLATERSLEVRTLAPENLEVSSSHHVLGESSRNSIRQRVTEAPSERGDRDHLRGRTTETPQVRVSVTSAALVQPAPRSEASLAPHTPPSPVIPKLGRVRSRRREDIGP